VPRPAIIVDELSPIPRSSPIGHDAAVLFQARARKMFPNHVVNVDILLEKMMMLVVLVVVLWYRCVAVSLCCCVVDGVIFDDGVVLVGVMSDHEDVLLLIPEDFCAIET
jgi:hypothetical protein